MHEMLIYQDNLSKKYKYKKLPKVLSDTARQIYLNNLPHFLKIDGDESFQIKTTKGTLIANGYNRIVIGDYGAFIEFDSEQVIRNNLKIKHGEEYRIKDPNYNQRVKYHWLTAKDSSNIKVYYQKRTVSYADYKPDMFYVSPYEIGN